ncbi:homeobox domain-containing protein [Ditylenchus destructor]|uniref:Homeobox domain-containing protein n=1 Tax=Ditylenchus destructor TaxID=166010 RepID=A0AAD4R8I8_9BILA|nr:homeobox domain-containing protein [Ditylenchus destructor]
MHSSLTSTANGQHFQTLVDPSNPASFHYGEMLVPRSQEGHSASVKSTAQEKNSENENRSANQISNDSTNFNSPEPCTANESYAPTNLRPDHIQCICAALENSANIATLDKFVSNFSAPILSDHPCREALLRAKALVLFHVRKFDEFYKFVESTQFAPEHHNFLQSLWNEAHYIETELQRGRKLDPVSRYRVRKKNAFPRTIWDGDATSYCFKKNARKILKDFYEKQQTPTHQQKQELAKSTKLSVVQVSNWFKNQRQRARQQRREFRRSCSLPDSSSDGAESEGPEDNNTTFDENETPAHGCGQPKDVEFVDHQGSSTSDLFPQQCGGNENDHNSRVNPAAAVYAAAAQMYYGTTMSPAQYHSFYQHSYQQPIHLTMNFAPQFLLNNANSMVHPTEVPPPPIFAENLNTLDSTVGSGMKYQCL